MKTPVSQNEECYLDLNHTGSLTLDIQPPVPWETHFCHLGYGISALVDSLLLLFEISDIAGVMFLLFRGSRVLF